MELNSSDAAADEKKRCLLAFPFQDLGVHSLSDKRISIFVSARFEVETIRADCLCQVWGQNLVLFQTIISNCTYSL